MDWSDLPSTFTGLAARAALVKAAASSLPMFRDLATLLVVNAVNSVTIV